MAFKETPNTPPVEADIKEMKQGEALPDAKESIEIQKLDPEAERLAEEKQAERKEYWNSVRQADGEKANALRESMGIPAVDLTKNEKVEKGGEEPLAYKVTPEDEAFLKNLTAEQQAEAVKNAPLNADNELSLKQQDEAFLKGLPTDRDRDLVLEDAKYNKLNQLSPRQKKVEEFMSGTSRKELQDYLRSLPPTKLEATMAGKLNIPEELSAFTPKENETQERMDIASAEAEKNELEKQREAKKQAVTEDLKASGIPLAPGEQFLRTDGTRVNSKGEVTKSGFLLDDKVPLPRLQDKNGESLDSRNPGESSLSRHENVLTKSGREAEVLLFSRRPGAMFALLKVKGTGEIISRNIQELKKQPKAGAEKKGVELVTGKPKEGNGGEKPRVELATEKPKVEVVAGKPKEQVGGEKPKVENPAPVKMDREQFLEMRQRLANPTSLTETEIEDAISSGESIIIATEPAEAPGKVPDSLKDPAQREVMQKAIDKQQKEFNNQRGVGQGLYELYGLKNFNKFKAVFDRMNDSDSLTEKEIGDAITAGEFLQTRADQDSRSEDEKRKKKGEGNAIYFKDGLTKLRTLQRSKTK